MSESNIGESEINGWTMREMRDDKSIRYTTVFMKDNQIGNVVCSARLCKLLYDVISSIYPMRIREHQLYLLLQQPSTEMRDINKIQSRTFAN